MECGRTWLQKVISGERHMDFDYFLKLYKRMKCYVDTVYLSKLYESFTIDYYGDKEYEIIHYIKERLLETKKLNDYIAKCNGNAEYINEYINQYEMNESVKEIIQKIHTNMTEEIKCSNKEKRSPQLYINIPSNWKYIKNGILIILNVEGVKNTEGFKYLSNSCFENNEIAQINNYLTSVEFASYGYSTFESDANYGFPIRNNIFPYYIITSEKVMMISEDGMAYFENANKEILKKVSDSFESIISGKKRFLDIVSPEIFSSLIMDKIIDEKIEYFEISNRLNVARFYTKDVLRQIIENATPDRNFMIETLNMFYENSRNAVASMYFTIPSVRHFMETNDSKAEGGYFHLNFSYSIKLKILKHIYEYCKEGEGEIHMIKAEKYIASDGISIFGWVPNTICTLNYIYDQGRVLDAISVISSPEIARHMRNFNQYIMNSDICLNHDNSLRVFENLIRSYEGK